MDLKTRLDALRASRGAPSTSRCDAADAEPSLRARVERLRLRDAGRTAPADPAEALGAERLAPGLLHRRTRLGLGHRQGRWALGEALTPCASLPDARHLEPGGLLALDTETTGLSGGTGTTAFLVGVAAFEADGLVVDQYLLESFRGEAALLEQLAPRLSAAPGWLTFNGKSFDLPLLDTRMRLHGLDARAPDHPHLDLLAAVRRAFRAQWPDCRLATAEQRLLGYTRAQDLPGALAPLAWSDFLRRGVTARLGAVLEHNLWDLVSLFALLPALDAVYRDPQGEGASVTSVARARWRAGDEAEALGLLEASLDHLDRRGRLQLADWLGRCGREQDRISILSGVADEFGCGEARRRLAVYFEHRARDLGAALAHACALPADDASRRRVRRLQGKLASIQH